MDGARSYFESPAIRDQRCNLPRNAFGFGERDNGGDIAVRPQQHGMARADGAGLTFLEHLMTDDQNTGVGA